MIQLIAFIIFLVSVLGIVGLLSKKIPVLSQLPQNGYHGIKKNEKIAAIEKKLKEFHFDFFKKQLVLHKLLSKTRVWVMKIERRIDVLLHGIRKKAQELDSQVKEKK